MPRKHTNSQDVRKLKTTCHAYVYAYVSREFCVPREIKTKFNHANLFLFLLSVPFNEDDPENLKNYPCCDYNCCCGCCRRHFICTFPHYRRWRKVQYVASWVVLDPLMDLFITLCILGNTAFLMMDHEEISDNLAYISEEGNKVGRMAEILSLT